MNISSHITDTENISIIELTGRFSAYEAPPIKAWFKSLNSSSSRRIIVDLAQVNFIDSAALATLVQGLKLCRKVDRHLYLCGLQPQVSVIFEITRLNQAFEIFASRDEAINLLDQ